ncbi:MAG: PAS domain S-box protein [Ignavibacteria bacterium]|nr:PAS domain S-box protein [Ignavibacteria bacterium]
MAENKKSVSRPGEWKPGSFIPRVSFTAYEHSEYSIRLKVRFLFYLLISLLIGVLSTLCMDLYLHTSSSARINFIGIIAAQVTLFGVLLICLYFLRKGRFHIAAHLLTIATLTTIWGVMFIDRSEPIMQLDTVILICGVLSMLPIVVTKKVQAIIGYILANIGILFLLVMYKSVTANLSYVVCVEYLTDSIIALVFIGVVVYNNFSINSRSIEKAEADIKEREAAESALRISEHKYRVLIENLNEATVLIDKDEVIQFVNKKFTEKLGYKLDDIIGRTTFDTFVPEEQKELVHEANSLRKFGISSQYELTLINRDGEQIPFLVSGAPIKDGDEIFSGSIATLTDITERKKIEDSIRASEERFRLLIESSPFAISVTDITGKYLLINTEYSLEFGFSQEEVIGKTPIELGMWPTEAQMQAIYTGLSESGKIEHYETTKFDKNGTEIPIYFSSRLVTMNGEPVVLSSLVNMTEKKKAEQVLERYRENLEQLVKQRTEELSEANEELLSINNELLAQREELQNALAELHLAQNQLIEAEKMASVGILAAGIAHEINNPLNFILGGVAGIEDYIQESMPGQMEELAPLISGIKMGVERASKIVTSLNHFSRSTDALDENCDVHSVIDNCLIMLENTLKHRVKITRDYSDVRFFVKGNEGKLHQAILNILTNANQAIDDEGTIIIHTLPDGDNVRIEIIDTGEGISSAILDKIFDPFFTTKEPGHGTGLGLSITYNIIKEHCGKIFVSSETAIGTRVMILLPLIKE